MGNLVRFDGRHGPLYLDTEEVISIEDKGSAGCVIVLRDGRSYTVQQGADEVAGLIQPGEQEEEEEDEDPDEYDSDEYESVDDDGEDGEE